MKEQIVTTLAAAIPSLTAEEISSLIEIPPTPDMGDFAFPCFRLAKTLRKAPPMIASEIAASLSLPDAVDEVKVVGAYINFFLKKEGFVASILEKVRKENYGSSSEGEGKTICIDYSSPNVAKNFHVGHLRTTIIGNSLHLIFKKLGYHVERINHLGDWGTQFGKLIVAYKNWGSEEAVKEKGIEELMRLYVLFHQEADKDPALEDEARAWFAKMEQGDEEALSIWKWFVDISLEEFKRTYKLLGMEFDHYTGESFYRDKTADVVKRLSDAGILTESEGARIVDLSAYDMAPCLILKKDGSSIYATRDIAAIIYRKENYNFEKCLYVTGQEQRLHFRQVFKVMELLGNEWAKDGLVHIPYGLVSLGGEKLSSRDGNVIFAEDILLEAVKKVREIIEERNPELEDKDTVAEKVGVGAVIFNDLYNQRIKDVSFRWEHLLNFEGETGPYVQYTYARCSSILRKVENYSPDADIDCSYLTDEASLALLKQLELFPSAVQEAATRYEPCVIARYAIAVAQAFNHYYTVNRINVPEDNIRNARVLLVDITRRTLRDALALLGITCVEAM
ncbi:MAG: arginine--tRNA ligase [Eubacterium sp.]|nr:arginine--tRNA ligase [Eubacterium sp.]